jgi:hypothetical protein
MPSASLATFALLAALCFFAAAEDGGWTSHDVDDGSNLESRTCNPVVWTGVILWGTNPAVIFSPPPYKTGSDSGCRSICDGFLAWTRRQSTDDCYCVNQPLSKPGTAITASLNADWNTGFYPNVSPPTAGCSSFALSGQKVMFNGVPPAVGPIASASNAACSVTCYSNGRPVWTRIADTGYCYCGYVAGPFQPSAILYDANAAFGVNAIPTRREHD